jgi:hypothetical protein
MKIHICTRHGILSRDTRIIVLAAEYGRSVNDMADDFMQLHGFDSDSIHDSEFLQQFVDQYSQLAGQYDWIHERVPPPPALNPAVSGASAFTASSSALSSMSGTFDHGVVKVDQFKIRTLCIDDFSANEYLTEAMGDLEEAVDTYLRRKVEYERGKLLSVVL